MPASRDTPVTLPTNVSVGRPATRKRRTRMRMMLKVSIPVETGNAAIRDGSIVKKIQSILADLKPEAAYFTEFGGERTALIFFDMKDTSEIPAIAEPWFLAFDASVEIKAVMNADDLARSQPGMEKAVKSFG